MFQTQPRLDVTALVAGVGLVTVLCLVILSGEVVKMLFRRSNPSEFVRLSFRARNCYVVTAHDFWNRKIALLYVSLSER